MNIILISDDRLKVTLTDRDLDGYGIRVEDIDYDNTETRRVFWTILDQAKNETGFNAALFRIFIQIYPDRRGGCEMYVSRIDGERGKRKSSDGIRCTVNKSGEAKIAEYIYRFEQTEHLLSACKALKRAEFRGHSEAYIQKTPIGDTCYLIISSEAKWTVYPSEYGELCKEKYARWYIAERCSPICEEKATEILGDL